MFVIAAVGNFIAMLDATTVNLALYPMSVDLHVTMSQIQWVMIAYMLVLTVFLPFFGKLGDIFPKNKLYALGFSIFALGAFLNTTAPTFGLLVTYRCIEAIGASIMLSNAQAIIAGIFKKRTARQSSGVKWLYCGNRRYERACFGRHSYQCFWLAFCFYPLYSGCNYGGLLFLENASACN